MRKPNLGIKDVQNNLSSPAQEKTCIELANSAADVLSNLSTSVVVCDCKLRIRLINPAAQSLLDVSEKNAVCASIAQFLDHPDAAAILSDSINRSQPTIIRHINIVDSSNRTKLVDCMLSPAPADPAQWLILEFNEINVLARDALERKLDRGHSANTAVMRGLAHEIKNPLGGLRGAAQLLGRELADQKHLKNYTRIIVQETDRLCNLVDAMSSPQAPLKLNAVNVHEILEHVRMLVLAETSSGISIARDYDPSLPPVLCDREQMIQAVLNIVRNAGEAAQDSSVQFRTRVMRQATIDSMRHSSVARIDIEDDGPGIPAEILEHVFYPMISGSPQGDGLGLSIVHQIVKRHGGHISCESKPGRTCFTILLKFAGRRTGLSVVPVDSGRS